MTKLGREIVNALLAGPSSDGRLVHDSPIRGDVWATYADRPGGRVDVLIEAFRNVPTGLVASRLAHRLYHAPATAGFVQESDESGFGISVLEGFVTAQLSLRQLIYAVLPYTAWVRDLRILDDSPTTTASEDARPGAAIEERNVVDELSQHVHDQLEAMKARTRVPEPKPPIARLAGTFRILAALDWFGEQDGEDIKTLDQFFAVADIQAIARLAGTFVNVTRAMRRDAARASDSAEVHASDIFAVSRNRSVELALDRSIPAVKADAVSSLFGVSCERIGWAVLDTGIAGDHPAFRNQKKSKPGKPVSRVVATYDFTRLRQIVAIDHIYNPPLLEKNAQILAAATGLDVARVRDDLNGLAQRAQLGRSVDWSITEPYVRVADPEPPENPHGTHVAGILGGCWGADDNEGEDPLSRRGVCIDIKLYDFRVVSGSEDDTEFAVVGALQFIRHLNARNNYPMIHGANISLSIRHDVRNYACGRTPVCEEAERVVNSGVVVVAAAGNRGHQSYHLTDGSAFETYAPSSITDPGNAEAVITVGATHRSAPHSYGVSFFSSRGPTGDGRAKPDLVAPGEKIWSVVPNGTEDSLSGTSMAAPHVSGAAALLMARNAEFIGQAATIKRILCSSCTDLGRERSFQGAGMLDILRAMQSV